jgi:exodeoxyribonuclease-3
MRLVSWNVNGLRAVLQKGFLDFVKEIDADIICLQETKAQPYQIDLELEGYHQYYHSALRKGYSSTAIYTRKKPLKEKYDFEDNYDHPNEGRIMTFEYDNFYLVNAYVPNSQDGLARLDYRMLWEDHMLEHLKKLDEHKPVIYCGDLNVAKEEIDLKNPSTNRKNAGFTDEERDKMRRLLSNGFVDSFRYLYPDTIKYSWWSYRFNARKNNVGWRIDYFIVSERLKEKIIDSKILNEVFGSDHCPVVLEIDI